MRKKRAFALAVVLLGMQPAAHSAVTNLVIDITTRPGVMVRVLYNAPDAPIAHLIQLRGTDGVVGIQPDGSLPFAPADAYARIASWLAAGVAFTLVDTPFASPIDPTFRRSALHAADIEAAVRNLQQRAQVPAWLFGLGSGAISAASVAGLSFPHLMLGVILGNPHTGGTGTMTGSDMASIHTPTLVIDHAQDTCPVSLPENVPFLVSQLVNAPTVKHVVLTGGEAPAADPCDDFVGPHAWGGLYDVVVDTVVGWIKQSGPLLESKATAIEYFHSDFNHYFITADATEIERLDAGAFVGWARTMQSFSVSTTGGAGRVPVCRFFTVAFPPTSSHFYAPRGLGCEDTLGNADWQFEGDVFFVALPDAAGACPPNYVPVYRLYNNGQGGAPNHRFTVSGQIRAEMLAAGYIAEGAGIGIGMCSPQ
jgi:hypothetical protein